MTESVPRTRATPRGDAPERTAAPRPRPRARATADEAARRCLWCGRELEPASGPGRPKRYCRQGCRQQAHMARKLAAAHGLGDDDLIISRTALEELQSRLYCLQAAIEDTERDLERGAEPDDVREAYGWLLENARPVAALWIEPRTGVGA